MVNAKAIDDFIEEKLLHLHTAYLAKVIRINSPTDITVEPLTLTQQIGKKPKKQAVLTGLSCISQAWKYIGINAVVLCVVCERDITEAKNGKNSVPSLGRHEMKDSIIIGTIGGTDQAAEGCNSVENAENYSNETVNKLFREAEKYLGTPYTFGGTPPRSFDCSGYVCWVFSNSGVKKIPRTTAQGIYNQCRKIKSSEARAGDLVFFTKTYNAGRAVTHVGIYAGNDKMIHCGEPIQYTSLKSNYWQKHLYGYGRLIEGELLSDN